MHLTWCWKKLEIYFYYDGSALVVSELFLLDFWNYNFTWIHFWDNFQTIYNLKAQQKANSITHQLFTKSTQKFHLRWISSAGEKALTRN